MHILDVAMRVLAGIGGVSFLAGGVYLLVAAAKTSGVGFAGTFLGFFGLTALALGIGFVVAAARSPK